MDTNNERTNETSEAQVAPQTVNKNMQDMAIRALAIIGLLAVLAGVSFAAISATRFSKNGIERSFSYLSAAAVNLISIFIPATPTHFPLQATATEIKSGEQFSLSFTPPSNKEGSYTISYPCLAGFYLQAITADKGAQTVLCNAPFHFVNIDNTVSLIPISTESPYVDMPITVSFTENGKTNPTMSGAVTITVAQGTTTSSTTSAVANPTSGTTTSHPVQKKPIGAGTKTEQIYPNGTTTRAVVDEVNGTPDLKVSVLAVGVMDRNTNAFVQSDTLSRSDYIGVRFAIENVGTKSTGNFRFNAILPTYPPQTFNSESQQSLAPGDRIEYTIGFNQGVAGDQKVTFVVDPSESIKELDETNNTASVNITIK